MSAAEAPAATVPAAPQTTPERRWPWRLALALVIGGALALRLWGIRHGLPYAYNADENANYVPRAIGLFGHDLNPHYFVNPPAFTYLLHGVLAIRFGGREGVSEAFATDPGAVFVVARATSAVLGAVAVGLVHLAGARLFDRRVGLLAAALLAVAFLPVFYGHLAVNDVPALAPIALSLWGAAGVLRRGRALDYAIAGAGLGLACATKYTGGIVLLALLGAAGARLATATGTLAVLRGLALAGVLAVGCFLLANPYALLDSSAFVDGLRHQATTSEEALGKLGETQESGHLYYLWALTWGLGWIPLGAAALGAGLLAARDRRALAVLAPALLLFVLYMGTQERYFGRWLLPIFPIACLLAAYGVVRLVELAGRSRLRRARPALYALGVAALLAQGLAAVIHNDAVLARADTRSLARAWLVEHVPAGAKVVIEPVVPDAWATDVGRPSAATGTGARWVKYATSRSARFPGQVVNVEDYARTLRPALLDSYARGGYCWVVSGSTQRGRAEAEPEQVPEALAYYRALDASARLRFEASPYRDGADPLAFSFDWSFNFYPRAYDRPGPLMRVYELSGGACAG